MTPRAERWTVLRHSGRICDGDRYRLVFTGSEEKASAVYHKLAMAMRQGTVILENPEGIEQERCSSPRLRKNW
jgi:hypothetical protein